jgi:ATP-binding cassette subfamily G (WHITE) protein 2
MPMPEEGGGVCYQNGEVVKENYQMCDVTNVKIVEILEGKKPQVTFTCNAADKTCAFQCETRPILKIGFISDTF